MKNDAMFGNIFVAKDFAILIQYLLNFLECYFGLKYVTSHLCIYLKENHNQKQAQEHAHFSFPFSLSIGSKQIILITESILLQNVFLV